MNIENLKSAYLNSSLDSLLDESTIDELLNYLKLISEVTEDSIYQEIRKKITENLNKRILNVIFDLDTVSNKFINNYYKENLSEFKISNPDVINRFYGEKNMKDIKWAPIGLSIESTYAIYKHLHSKGTSEEEIINLLTTNIEKSIELADKITKIDEIPSIDVILEDKDFSLFMTKCFNYCEENKSHTESFDKMYKNIEEKNRNLLKRLQ